MNENFFKGNLTFDPEVRNTPNGETVVNFTLAVNEQWKDKDGNKRESVVFPRFDIWGPSGETFAKYFKKGDQALVVAKYTQNTTGEGDEKKTFHGFRVNKWEFCGSKNGNSSKKEEKDEDAFEDKPDSTRVTEGPKRGRPAKAKVTQPVDTEEDDSDSIPF